MFNDISIINTIQLSFHTPIWWYLTKKRSKQKVTWGSNDLAGWRLPQRLSLVVSIPQLWPWKLSIHHSSVYSLSILKFQNVLRNNMHTKHFSPWSPHVPNHPFLFAFGPSLSPDRNITASHGLANGRGRSGQSVFLLEQPKKVLAGTVNSMVPKFGDVWNGCGDGSTFMDDRPKYIEMCYVIVFHRQK